MAEENQTENEDAKVGSKQSETTTEGSSNTVKEEPPFVLPLWIVGAVLLIGSFIFLNEFWSTSLSSSYRDWVVFSDYFSNLASPTIALAVLIYVYKTFEVQRKELNATKSALEKSYKEQEKQTQIQKTVAKVEIRRHLISHFKESKEFFQNGISQLHEKTEMYKREIKEREYVTYDYEEPNDQNDEVVKFLEDSKNDAIRSLKNAEQSISKVNAEIVDLDKEIDKI